MSINGIVPFLIRNRDCPLTSMIDRMRQARRAAVHRIMQSALSDASFARYWYWKRFKKALNLSNPKTFNEKIHWLKLHRRDPIIERLSDKYRVRAFVEERIGARYLIPMLAVFDHAAEIGFAALPSAFVLKCNHGSGLNRIVIDKTREDESEIKTIFRDWLALDYSRAYREWNYRGIDRRIICESLLEGDPDAEGRLHDFKIFCFNGQPRFIQVDVDRYCGHKRSIYDPDWVKQAFTFNHPMAGEEIKKPARLAEMLEVARALGRGFEFCRVDLYHTADGIFFGEITFYPEGGYCDFDPPSYNRKVGELLHVAGAARRGYG